jgi:hypothetical protein
MSPPLWCDLVTEWPSARSRDGGIDEIPLPIGPGRLWLCGKHAIGDDPIAAMARVGATTIVCLTEADELDHRYPAYLTWLRAHGRSGTHRDAVWFPIPDLHAPPIDQLLPMLADLRTRIGGGEGLLMHCAAGIGRSGTVAACLLITMGESRAAALETVAGHRPMAGPEVGAQRELVDAVANSITG